MPMNKHQNDATASRPGMAQDSAPRVSASYAWVVLLFLTLTNLLAFMDRYLINILAQPIKVDLQISDAQLGLLSGFAMSISYSLFGLPLAWLAERRSRVWIITASMIAWSFLTALCGRVTTYGQLVLARVGVGVGEAGAMPASHSLITDYFPPHRRGLALAIFTISIPIGAIAASIIGGWIVDHWGWREAFVYLGLPGAVVAIIFALVVREVPRGRHDAAPMEGTPPRMLAVAIGLWKDPVTRQVILAYTAVVLVTTGASTFFAPFLARKFALSYTMIGFVLSATLLGGGILGNLIGGYLSDKLGRRDPRWPMWVPAIGIFLAIPFYFASYLQPTVLRTAIILFLPSVIAVFFTPPTYAVLHARTDPRARSMMVAIVGLASGLPASLGPVLAGLTIDLLSEAYYPGSFATACIGGASADPAAAPAAAKLCADALLHGTTTMLLMSAPLLVWPALHYWLAARAIGSRPR
jgi:MFS family permease